MFYCLLAYYCATQFKINVFFHFPSVVACLVYCLLQQCRKREDSIYLVSHTHTHTHANAIHTCTCEMYSISLLLLKIDSESDSEEDETQDDDPFSPETEKFPNNSQHPFDPANLPLSAGNEVLRVVTFHTLLAPPPLPPRPQKTRIDPSQHYEVKGRRERGFILSLLSLSLSLSLFFR